MTPIGTFSQTRGGFEGRLHTLALDCPLVLVPAEESETDNAPDYRIMAGDGDASREVGAGWKRVGEKAGKFVAVALDDPAFAGPLRANLFQSDDGGYVLMWSRKSRRQGKE